MLPIVRRVLTLFLPFWKPLALISLIIMVQKAGDLAVPLFGGQVIDAMAQHRPLDATYTMIATAFLFWVCHGNMLPYVLGRVDLAGFQYAGPRHLGVSMLKRVLRQRVKDGRDTAMQQAIVERGEVVLVQFINAFVRVAIPVTIPGIVTLGMLLWWYPLIGLIAMAGGALDVLATIYLNSVLKPLYTRLQELDYERQRVHTHVFRNLLAIIIENKQHRTAEDYDERFATYAGFGAHTGRRFLVFNFGRGLIVNVTNLCTWVVGAWYVDGNVYSLGYFLASLSWSTYVLNCVGAGIELQKQWMETMPAIKAFFVEIDACGPANDDAEMGSAPSFAPAALATALSPH
ncbi:hypothetical protein [Azospirillum sp. sgz301742]